MKYKFFFTFILTGFILCINAQDIKLKHPCFLFNSSQIDELREKSLSNEWLRNMREVVIKDADNMLTVKTNPYELEDENEHIYLGIAGRAVQVRVLNLALAGYLTNERKYFDKSKEILLAVVEQTEPDDKRCWPNHHQVADLTQGLTLGFDLLYPYMTSKERKEVYDEIIKAGKQLYVTAGYWGGFSAPASSCNHNSVHHGALGLCALVAENHPEWLDRAIQRTEAFYSECADSTGYVYEGHHYLSYGFGGAFPFTQALKQVKGVDLFKKYNSLFAQAGEQILWNILPNGSMTVLNDSYAAPVGETIAYCAMMNNSPQQLWAWLRFAEDIPGEHEMNHYEQRGKYYLGLSYKKRGKYFSVPYGLPYSRIFLFLPDAKYTEPKAPDNNYQLTKYFSSGRVFARSAWTDANDAHISFTSGKDAHYGHNHQDENSFTFYALGETFINDPTYWPKYSSCHSTLKIDGKEQWVKYSNGCNTEGLVQKCEDRGTALFIRGEAKGAYDADAGVDYCNRKILFVKESPYSPYVIIRDDAAMRDARKTEFVTRFITKPEHVIKSDGDKGVIINTHSGAKALMLTFSGKKQITMKEDNLKGEKFHATVNGGDFLYSDYLKRISAKVDAVNPKFTTIILPYRNNDELPKVMVDENAGDLIYTLVFKNKQKHIITLTDNDINIKVNEYEM